MSRKWWLVLGGAGFFAAYVAGIAWVVSLFPPTTAEVKLCDLEVPILLHSDNLVDVTRAGILIREMNCGIGKRLP